MKAKAYLMQIQKLDLMIENKMAEKARFQGMARNTSPSYGGERVQTTRNPHRMEDAICDYIDIDREIDRRIDEFVDTKNKIIQIIEKLDASEYDLLHKHYVQYMDLQVIADKKGKSYSWATSLHGLALKHVQVILDRENIEE